MNEQNVDSKDEIQETIKGVLYHSPGYFIQLGKNVFLKREEIRGVICLGKNSDNDYEIRIEFVDGTVRKLTFIGGDIDKIKIN